MSHNTFNDPFCNGWWQQNQMQPQSMQNGCRYVQPFNKFNNSNLDEDKFIIIRRDEIAALVRDAVANSIAGAKDNITVGTTVPNDAGVGDVGLKKAEISIVIKLEAFIY